MWCIVVAEMVIGKSIGPKGFSRYKPHEYFDSHSNHPIVYYKTYRMNKSDIEKECDKVRKFMEQEYFMHLGNTSYGQLVCFDICAINMKDDEYIPVASSYDNSDLNDRGLLKMSQIPIKEFGKNKHCYFAKYNGCLMICLNSIIKALTKQL